MADSVLFQAPVPSTGIFQGDNFALREWGVSQLAPVREMFSLIMRLSVGF